ncbi:hypothetical protein MMC20_001316 [Loxospora ochrophaea]|nr:hypothetical protein [Loxospora ochrophaea]
MASSLVPTPTPISVGGVWESPSNGNNTNPSASSNPTNEPASTRRRPKRKQALNSEVCVPESSWNQPATSPGPGNPSERRQQSASSTQEDLINRFLASEEAKEAMAVGFMEYRRKSMGTTGGESLSLRPRKRQKSRVVLSSSPLERRDNQMSLEL